MFRLFKRKNESVYQRIQTELEKNKCITNEFQLTEVKEGELRFAAGASDGTLLYHFMGNGDETEAVALADLVGGYLLTGDKKIVKDILSFVDSSNYRAVTAAPNLTPKILENAELVNNQIDRYAALCQLLMAESASVEAVKSGIVLSEPLIGPYGEKQVEMLKTLGRYEEFTYFSLISLKNKLEENSFNELCIDYAKALTGWGKVHSITMIEEPNEAQQDWIVKNGCRNGSLDMYLGHECLEKGNVRLLLEQKEPLEKEIIDGVTGIFSQLLMEGGPIVGWELVAGDLELIAAYLQHIPEKLTTEQAVLLESLIAYITQHYSDSSEGQQINKDIQQLLQETGASATSD